MQIELKRIQQQLGITFIYITHDQEEALTMSDRIAVMRRGLFEQLGSAPDIYNKPATSYVARFVGNANILRGKLISKEKIDGKNILTIEVSGGTVKAAVTQDVASNTFAAGGSVTIAIRTEHVILSASGNSGLPAKINARSFTGGQLRITAVLKNGEEITASRHGMDSPLQIGEEVRVNWASPEDAILVEDTE
jgi:spermidine/putrescine transport system ATP-binding protein